MATSTKNKAAESAAPAGLTFEETDVPGTGRQTQEIPAEIAAAVARVVELYSLGKTDASKHGKGLTFTVKPDDVPSHVNLLRRAAAANHPEVSLVIRPEVTDEGKQTGKVSFRATSKITKRPKTETEVKADA